MSFKNLFTHKKNGFDTDFNKKRCCSVAGVVACEADEEGFARWSLVVLILHHKVREKRFSWYKIKYRIPTNGVSHFSSKIENSLLTKLFSF